MLGSLVLSLALVSALPPTVDVLKPAPWSAQMDDEIKDILKDYKGELAAYVSDPYLGHNWGYRAEVPMYLASGVKIAFMLEVYRQREQGRLRFSEELKLTETDLRDGAPRVNRLRVGSTIRIATLLDWMMRSSDNAASDLLVKRVGLNAINQSLKDMGFDGFTPLVRLKDVRVGVFRELDLRADDLTAWEVRKIRWTPIWDPQVRKLNEFLGLPEGTLTKADLLAAYDRFYATGVNRAPMRTMGRIFEEMLAGSLISQSASESMLKLMTHARTSTHRILGKLPHNIQTAHKTGSQYERLCDLGAVYLEADRPFIVTVCTQKGGVEASEEVVARVAKRAFDLIREARHPGREKKR